VLLPRQDGSRRLFGLEISRFPAMVLAGYRRDAVKSRASRVTNFRLGSFATAFFFLRPCRWCMRPLCSTTLRDRFGGCLDHLCWIDFDPGLPGLQVAAAPFPVWHAGLYEARPPPSRRFSSAGPRRDFCSAAADFQPRFHGHGFLVLGVFLDSSRVPDFVVDLGALVQTTERMLAYS